MSELRSLCCVRSSAFAHSGPAAYSEPPTGAFRLWGANPSDGGRGRGASDFVSNNASLCQKFSPFYADETVSPFGPGRCSSDCDCCGARNCSAHGFCVGDTNPESNPDCLPAPDLYMRYGSVRLCFCVLKCESRGKFAFWGPHVLVSS